LNGDLAENAGSTALQVEKVEAAHRSSIIHDQELDRAGLSTLHRHGANPASSVKSLFRSAFRRSVRRA
jgi:hypothetical protein